ncbi:hypothetical protein J2Z23_002000 [Lederbergia galactosidilyticus]|uniref:hypothetical protein n=1 Tax=Lederbergia galactosidilytica TaxID=217031 RepID=UPI001AE90F9A|nr:hypothetical protein [Lederbergia galactosidilytica]MBP1915045.1 hypothetical protein [Lederbergia galactosidilytica]
MDFYYFSRFLLSGCKANDVYNEREKDIKEAIETQLQLFGIRDYTKYKITNKGAAGEAFAPHSYEFTFQYTGEEAIPFKSKVRIDYKSPEKGAVEAPSIAEDYAQTYFSEGIDLEGIKGVLLDYFAEEEIENIGTFAYSDFSNQVDLPRGATVQKIEKTVEKWKDIVNNAPAHYYVSLHVEEMSPTIFQDTVNQLKDRLPYGEYSLSNIREQWQVDIFVTNP